MKSHLLTIIEYSYLPEAIKDVRGVSNDTLQYNVVSQSLEDYGNVYLDVIRNSSSKFILQMIDSNGEVIRVV